jgi:hypothetical protein
VAQTHLFSDEIVEEVDRWRLEEQVVRDDIVEEARIAVP